MFSKPKHQICIFVRMHNAHNSRNPMMKIYLVQLHYNYPVHMMRKLNLERKVSILWEVSLQNEFKLDQTRLNLNNHHFRGKV